MDYDSIEKGRRRNWDALKPEDQRAREKEEERARKREEREKAGKQAGYFERRREMLDEARARDIAEYRRALRRSALLGGGLVLAITLQVGISAWLSHRRETAHRNELRRAEERIQSGAVVTSREDPFSAYATWRSAWLTGDMRRVAGMVSPTLLVAIDPRGNRQAVEQRYQDLWARGQLAATQEIAINFVHPEAVRIPERPWRDKQLAIFRSRPVFHADRPTEEIRHILALSYDIGSKSWCFADLREAKYFNVQWEFEGQIKPLKAPNLAEIYDSEGRLVRR
jgi:hypothetical protein